jgi:predicted Zn finger-like uncharacterized protein
MEKEKMTYVNKVRTECTECHTALIVKNPDNMESKQVRCPNCKQLLKVKFPCDERMVCNGIPPQTEQPNTLMGNMPPSKPRIHVLHTPSGEEKRLAEGVNTVGRASSKSQATIQLHVDDVYMSRHCAQIELRRLPNGHDRVSLSYWNSKNPIQVNGVRMEANDVVVLHHADRITLGRTVIVYEALDKE